MTAAAVFEAHDLGKVYRPAVRALEGITLAIGRGGFTVVTGPSGSGKTTLLALLGALERPGSGRLLFDGQDLTRCSDAALARVRRRMGFVFQDFALIPKLSALENVAYPLIPRRLPPRERRRRAAEWLSRMGLGARLAARAADLSGGEQQRVAVARALAGGPEVVLADEPTSSLDAETAGVLLEALKGLPAEGRTVVVASHDPRVLGLATGAIALRAGRLA